MAASSYGYDHDGNLTSLTDTQGATTFAGYSWTYDAGGRVLTFANSQHSTEDLTYSYDADNQLTGATYTGDSSTEEAYTYDANGSRATADNNNGDNTYTAGTDNQIADDGTYSYQYDADGNLIKQTRDADGSYTVYAYDNRNRLTSATSYSEGSTTPTQQVTYTYDVFNNLIGESVTKSSGTTHQAFVFNDPANNGQMVLAFKTTGSATPTAANLTDRYLWGPAVDQLMSDESTSGVASVGTVEWALGDNENTIRDWVNSSGVSTGHATYNAFGLQTGATGYAASADVVFAYTGKFYDAATKLQWNVNRWYNPETGTWMSQDPIGFAGGQANLSEYVGNDPTDEVDPTGLLQYVGYEWNVFSSEWWSGYGSYLAHPSRQDPDIRMGQRIAAGTAIVAGGAAVGLIVGGAAITAASAGSSATAAAGDIGAQVIIGNSVVAGAGVAFGPKAAQYAGEAVGLAMGLAGVLPNKVCPLKAPSGTFPNTAEEMDIFLGFEGTRIPDGPMTPGRGKVLWEPNEGTKIILEKHPYHPSAPPFHRDPHYHVDLPGMPPHQRFMPGDPIPGM